MIRKNHGLFLAGMECTQYCRDEIFLKPGDRLLHNRKDKAEYEYQDGCSHLTMLKQL